MEREEHYLLDLPVPLLILVELLKQFENLPLQPVSDFVLLLHHHFELLNPLFHLQSVRLALVLAWHRPVKLSVKCGASLRRHNT